MKKPVLVIMAAGMGSRYGGLKQIDPVDEDGHIIIDFSIYDAKRAGFEKVVFIIRREHEEDFRKSIGDRVSKFMEVEYVYQELENLPEGFSVPEGRTKPFGTGHAILSCKDVVDGPFAVINADDYYGVNAYKMIYDYLSSGEDNEKYRYAMVGYMLSNTLTENGYVSRGICDTDENQCLTGITERTHIEKTKDGAAFTEDDGTDMGSCSIGYDSFHELVWIYCEYVKGTGEQIFRIFDRESGEESDEMRILSSGSRRRSDRRRKSRSKSAQISRQMVWSYI